MEPSDGSDVVRGERFSGGPARGFLSSLAADERIFEADLAVDRAHVVMLTECDVISVDSATRILDALADIERAGFDALPDGEDVHAAIETAVVDVAGDPGRRMHTARSRNDEVATCIRHQLGQDILAGIAAVLDLRRTLIDQASQHDSWVMPGHTHLQPAQPTTLGHWHLAYESALRRATGRLVDAYDRVNQCPLGAAAFAGTSFAIDRERTAELLGFDTVLENSMDAVAARDFLVETAAALAGLASTLAGLSTDVIHFCNRGYLDLDEDFASTSSIMPQKVNPDTLELVRASAGDATAGLNGILTTLKGLPMAYNRDLQRATGHMWSTVDSVVEAIGVTDGALTSAAWDESVLETAASAGFATATGVAEHLAMNGVPFRSAHQIVATAAQEGADLAAIEAAVEQALGRPLSEIVDPTEVQRLLQPRYNVAARESFGGPAPTAVHSAIDRATEHLEEDVSTLSTAQSARADAAAALANEVEQYR